MGTSQVTAYPQTPIHPKIDSGIKKAAFPDTVGCDWLCTPVLGKTGTGLVTIMYFTVLSRS